MRHELRSAVSGMAQEAGGVGLTMARLIDADNLIAEIKNIYCDGCNNYGGVKCRACWVYDAMCLIDDATIADAVEVVRCKDCIYYHKAIGYGFGQCSKCSLMPYQDDFCSYGERKDGADND